MLLTKDLIKGVEEKYIPMLEQVNIVEFSKCIAQFSGLSLESVRDEVIEKYLLTWAKNKYELFKMLGNKLVYDTTIRYKNQNSFKEQFQELMVEFPIYAPWLHCFRNLRTNKIDRGELSWDTENWIKNGFNQNPGGMMLTHFFKHYLKAPEELVTKIAAIFENIDINSNYTLSIDPVDMMLASENPYKWDSCYRLELGNTSSHADGCLAAILDKYHLIAYVWDREGKFKMYNKYEFKCVRFKRMRQWIAISPNKTNIHFNNIYPNKTNYTQEFEKIMRDKVETLVAEYMGIRNIWKPAGTSCVERCNNYGYSEYYDGNIYMQTDAEPEGWEVFEQGILCPCGCGQYLMPTYDCDDDYDGEVYYNGEGFCCYNFERRYYCEYAQEYCSSAECCCADCCCDCWAWKDAHPVCELDGCTECQNPYDVDDGVAICRREYCEDCPLYKEHKREFNEDDEE